MQIISKGRIISSRIVLFPFCFVMFSQTKSLSFQHFHFHMFFHFYQVFEFEIFCSFEIGRGICSSGEIISRKLANVQVTLGKNHFRMKQEATAQLTFMFSMSTIETLEKSVKYVQS